MKWFRSNIRHGSRLALFALAVQFAMSFGHFHGIAAQAAAAAIQSSPAQSAPAFGDGPAIPDAVTASAQQPSPSNNDSDQHRDPCAICAVMALANAALFATPPLLLLLPQAVEFLYVVGDAEFIHIGTPSVAFQSRAPPLS